MARRKRKAIPLREQLAAALACLLSQEERDALRSARVPSSTVRALFEMDHIILAAHDGGEGWWNIDPKPKASHREKSRLDTTIAAKVKRLQHKTVAGLGLARDMVEAMDRQMPHQAPTEARGAPKFQPPQYRRVNGALVGLRPPKPKRRIPSRKNPWPPKGSRPFLRKP